MGILGYFIDNYVMLYELIGIFAILRISTILSERMRKLTVSIIIFLFIESVVFALEKWTQSFETLSHFRPVLTSILYSIYPLILMLLILLTETDEFSKRSLLFAIPWACCVPLFFSSQWTHLVCWYTNDNHYMSGPLKALPYWLFAFYALIFLVQNIRFFRSYSRMNRAVVRYIVIGALLGVLLYVLLEVNQDYSAIFTSAILLYYVLVYIYMAKMDPLTSLPNRQSCYQDLTKDTSTITGIISVDMNDLQNINDTLGHENGDMALVVVSGVLKHHCPRNSTVYRVGGDEFTIICRKVGEEEIKSTIAAMKKKLVYTSYSCAFGYAMCSSDVNVYDAITLADARMNKDKNSIKSNESQNV